MKKVLSYTNCSVRGFSLIEVIVSSALILLLATLFIGAVLSGQEGSVMNGAHARAILLAEEGLEAARDIRNMSFAALTDGTYGIATSTGLWTLAGTNNTIGIFTRNVNIQTIDTSTKQITSTVSWQKNGQRTAVVSLVTHLVNTSLLVPQIKSLEIDVSGGHTSNSTRLVGVKIKNVGSNSITLSSTTVAWVGGSQTNLVEIDINGKTVWSTSGIYPIGPQPSGTEVGINPVVMNPNSQTPINNFIFDGSIRGSTFTINFVMSDNSSTTISLPPLP